MAQRRKKTAGEKHQETHEARPGEILIKKYDNRRLYCVNEARYVSLSEIREMIAAGKTVRVIEKKSGKDITRLTMAQILLEERYNMLPEFFLRMLIQAPESFLERFFREFLPPMLDLYLKILTNPSFFQSPAATQFLQNPAAFLGALAASIQSLPLPGIFPGLFNPAQFSAPSGNTGLPFPLNLFAGAFSNQQKTSTGAPSSDSSNGVKTDARPQNSESPRSTENLQTITAIMEEILKRLNELEKRVS